MKVEPYEADNAKAATNTLSSSGTMLSPLATSLQLYGLYVPRERKGLAKKLQWFYACLLATMFWANIIRISCVFLREKDVSARLTLSASIFIWVLGSTYLHSASLYAFSKHLDTFQSMMTSYHEKYVFSFKPAHVKRILRYMCILNSVASTGIIGSICYISATPGTIASMFLNPFDEVSPGMRIACLSLAGIILFLLCANGFSNINYFLIVCYCLGKEFGAFNTAVQNMITQKCLDEKLETLRMRHTQLCRLIAQANTMTKHLLFTTLTMAIPVFCFVLFGIVRGSIGVEDLLASVLMLMILVAILLFTLIPAGILNIKAHDCLDDIMNANLVDVTERTLQIIAIFATRLNGPQIGFHVYRLFTVDTSMILTLFGTLMTYVVFQLFGTLMTYVVVVLQLKPEY